MKTIVTVVGARPQFVKCAAVSRELRKKFHEVLIHTGQHYDAGMSEVFFKELGIPEPDINLHIGSGSHGAQTGLMLIHLEEEIQKIAPDLVLTYGDTNSTLAGALVAAKLHIPVAHVEAGLRSFDRKMPEEVNRVMADHLSSLLFCPTQTAVDNLKQEGITDGVFLTGDVMVDALRSALDTVTPDSAIGIDGDYYLATIHRPSNTDDANTLGGILQALNDLDHLVLFPVHPRTRASMEKWGLEPAYSNIRMIDPQPYTVMIRLMGNARAVLTDSGGVQKEAYMLRKPCITLRENTEWIETVNSGWNVLTGPDYDRIISAVKQIDKLPDWDGNIYGDGKSAERICAIIKSFLEISKQQDQILE